MTELIRTEKLMVGYPGKRILGPLDVTLISGELVCLMGPNGSGKTTLLRVLAGLRKELSGSVYYSWQTAPSSGPQPAHLAVVLTDRPWNAALTVTEVILMGRYPYQHRSGTDEYDTALNELDALGISHLAEKTLNQLSDGQRQLVMIARAFAQEPTTLLLDEPTSHLDLNHRVEIMNRLCDWSKEKPGRSVLMATHELDLALQRADRLWLTAGEKVISGIPEDLVLDGVLDEIFRLKGFTLKTGKTENRLLRFPVDVDKSEAVPDYVLLWTRNALERQGHPCRNGTQGSVTISIQSAGDSFNWGCKGKIYTTIGQLLADLSGADN